MARYWGSIGSALDSNNKLYPMWIQRGTAPRTGPASLNARALISLSLFQVGSASVATWHTKKFDDLPFLLRQRSLASHEHQCITFNIEAIYTIHIQHWVNIALQYWCNIQPMLGQYRTNVGSTLTFNIGAMLLSSTGAIQSQCWAMLYQYWIQLGLQHCPNIGPICTSNVALILESNIAPMLETILPQCLGNIVVLSALTHVKSVSVRRLSNLPVHSLHEVMKLTHTHKLRIMQL